MSKANENAIQTLSSVLDEGEYIIDFPMDYIRIKPQVRRKFKEGKVAEIAESMLINGQLSPVIISYPDDDGFCDLIFGFTRYEANALNKKATIKAVQREVPEYVRVIQMAENMHREDLDIVDTALGILELSKEMKPKLICEKLLVKSAWVSKMLAIGKVPVETLDKLAPISNDMESYYLLAQLYKISQETAEVLINEAIESGELKRSTIKDALAKIKGGGSDDSQGGDDQNTDGQNTDGQNTDGQNTDGQNTGGQNTDGQNIDGQNIDGQNTDGDDTEGQNTGGEENTPPVKPKKATYVFVSFVDEGETIEGYLLLDDKHKAKKGTAWVSIDGHPVEMPLEELKIVRVSHA